MSVPTAAMSFRSLQEGLVTLYVLRWPPGTVGEEDGLSGLCMVIMKRQGGAMLGLPAGLIPMEELQGASALAPDSVLGAHSVLVVPGVIAGDPGEVAEEELSVLVIDVLEEVLSGLVAFDPTVHVESTILGFSEDLAILPDARFLLQAASDWLTSFAEGRVTFYSAEEAEEVATPPPTKAKAKGVPKEGKAKASEKAKKSGPQLVAEHISQLSQIVPAMASQLSHLQEEQKRMFEALHHSSLQVPPRRSQAPISMPVQNFAKLMATPPAAGFAKMMGSPPRTKVPAMPTRGLNRSPGPDLDGQMTVQEQAEEAGEVIGDPLALAVLEQSKALTSLVAQMSQGGDPLLDGNQNLGLSSTSTKGAMGREKLQQDLANRTGGFLLSVLQNAYRRLKPASRTPSSLQELADSDFSMVQYLERFGGYAATRELGTIQYALSFIIDCALREDLKGVQEHAALLTVGLEQASLDAGRWDLAGQLLLLEEPSAHVWSHRGVSSQSGRARAFAPLCPQRWATIAIAYSKEIDYIHSSLARRTIPQTLLWHQSPRRRASNTEQKVAEKEERRSQAADEL